MKIEFNREFAEKLFKQYKPNQIRLHFENGECLLASDKNFPLAALTSIEIIGEENGTTIQSRNRY